MERRRAATLATGGVAADLEARLAGLRDLQRALLLNGFRMLRGDGLLVYSTCSFARAQNEDVVEWLLRARHELGVRRRVPPRRERLRNRAPHALVGLLPVAGGGGGGALDDRGEVHKTS